MKTKQERKEPEEVRDCKNCKPWLLCKPHQVTEAKRLNPKKESAATHTPGAWEVIGPVKEGTLDIATGKLSEMKDAGYGVRAIEPKMFGGTEIGIEKGLTKANADFIAAAPDMRKQLEDDLEYFEANRDDVYCRVRSRRIKNLLDKAEGRNV